MFIQTEPTPNPATLKFLPGRPVLASGTLEMRDKDSAAQSPLAARLFDIAGISGVFYGFAFGFGGLGAALLQFRTKGGGDATGTSDVRVSSRRRPIVCLHGCFRLGHEHLYGLMNVPNHNPTRPTMNPEESPIKDPQTRRGIEVR